jgi:hypothetical protein
MTWTPFHTKAIEPIPNYKGYRFFARGRAIGDVYTDHFTWERRIRSLNSFLDGLNRVKPIGSSEPVSFLR